MKAFKQSVSVLLAPFMTISLIPIVPFTTNAAGDESVVSYIFKNQGLEKRLDNLKN